MKGTAIFEFPDEGVLRCYVHDFDLPIKCKRLVKGGKPGVIIEGRITNPSNILFTVLNEYVEISNSPNSKTFSFTFVERLVEQTNEFQMTNCYFFRFDMSNICFRTKDQEDITLILNAQGA